MTSVKGTLFANGFGMSKFKSDENGEFFVDVLNGGTVAIAHVNGYWKCPNKAWTNDNSTNTLYINTCPDGWLELVPGKCYKKVKYRMTWDGARVTCQKAFGAKLAEPRNDYECKALMKPALGSWFWLGMTDYAIEGRFVYASDNSLVYPKSACWYPEANQGYQRHIRKSQDCIWAYKKHAHWDDIRCNYRASFLCEKSLCAF